MRFVVDKVPLGQVFLRVVNFISNGAPLIVKLGKKTAHLHHRVAQEALRLRCVRSVCCGALQNAEKKAHIEVSALLIAF